MALQNLKVFCPLAVLTFDKSLCKNIASVQFGFLMEDSVTFATHFQQNSANVRKGFFLSSNSQE